MIYSRRRLEDELWHIHAPLKKEKREIVTVPPPSQIPYLNGVMDNDFDINSPKSIYVEDTDPDYIHMPKLRSRLDLLVHRDPALKKSKEPVGYPTPDWWNAMCTPVTCVTVDKESKRSTGHMFDAPHYLDHKNYQKRQEENQKPYCADGNNKNKISHLGQLPSRKN